jgi:hypothetical protein
VQAAFNSLEKVNGQVPQCFFGRCDLHVAEGYVSSCVNQDTRESSVGFESARRDELLESGYGASGNLDDIHTYECDITSPASVFLREV